MKNNEKIIKLRMRRVGAAAIDWYVSTALAATSVTFFTHKTGPVDALSFKMSNYDLKQAMFIGMYAILLGLFYYVVVPKVLLPGQTFGKKICGIQVLNDDDTAMTWKSISLREIVGSMLIEGGIVVHAIYLRQLIAYFTPIPYSLLMNIAYATTILSIALAYFSRNSKMVHEIISKTKVVVYNKG